MTDNTQPERLIFGQQTEAEMQAADEARAARKQELRTTPKVAAVSHNVAFMDSFTEWLDAIHDLGMCIVPIRGGKAATLAVPAGVDFDQLERSRYRKPTAGMYRPFLQAMADAGVFDKAPPCDICGRNPAEHIDHCGAVICDQLDCTTDRTSPGAAPKAKRKAMATT